MMAHITPDKQEELVNLLEQMIQNIESEDQSC